MSLREEIQLIVARIDEDHTNHEDETMLIINKVLDAAVGTVEEMYTKVLMPQDSVQIGRMQGKADAINAINKLMGEK